MWCMFICHGLATQCRMPHTRYNTDHHCRQRHILNLTSSVLLMHIRPRNGSPYPETRAPSTTMLVRLGFMFSLSGFHVSALYAFDYIRACGTLRNRKEPTVIATCTSFPCANFRVFCHTMQPHSRYGGGHLLHLRMPQFASEGSTMDLYTENCVG